MLHRSHSRQTALLLLLAALLAGYSAGRGIFDETLYAETVAAGTISEFLHTGSLAQDYITLPAAAALAAGALLFLFRGGVRLYISLLGIAGYLFYGYSLYTMQGQYTSVYLVYVAIVSLSLYGLIWGLAGFRAEGVARLALPRALRRAVAAYLLAVVGVLTPVWLSLISGDLARRAPGDTYMVFVLDLCIVFPAFVLIAGLLLRNRPFGNVLAGVALLKGLTVCLSVAFGEWFQAFQGGNPPQYGMIALFGGLTALSLALLAGYLTRLEERPEVADGGEAG